MQTTPVLGYAARAAGQPLEPFQYASPELGEQDVRVSVTHCGLCYSDIQAIDDHYGITPYPFVPGHEVVGTVTAVGRSVSSLQVGDRVGIGWQGRCCMQCEYCLQGEEQLCEEVDVNGTWIPYGGFATSVVVDGRFAYRLPDGMPADVAAVLMCGGISVFAPLRAYLDGGSKKVGVAGVGGLGHLAIQFAHAMGCEVTAISSSPQKEEEAFSFGADHFVNTRDPAGLRKIRLSLDLLLSTSHGSCDWESMLYSLKTNKRLVILGFSDSPVSFNPMELVVHQYSISGSFVGSRAAMQEMLEFAQVHSITPMIEQMPLSKVNEAIQRLRDNKARYRIVLQNDGQSG